MKDAPFPTLEFPRTLASSDPETSRSVPIRKTTSGKKRQKRPKKPEDLYRDLIKAGLVRIERRRGKPPLVVWLNKPLVA